MEVLTDNGDINAINLDTALPKRFFFEERFPFPECSILEFKRSFREENKQRYIETGCAFLNSGGGYLVFGVVDHDRTIIGCRMGIKDIDTFNIFADHLYQLIYHTDGTIIPSNCIRTRIDKITKNRYVCIIGFYPEKDGTYQLANGLYYRRMNASNKRYSGAKLYLPSEITVIVAKYETEKAKALELAEKRKREEVGEYLKDLEDERDNKKKEILEKEKQVIIDINQIMYNYYHHPMNKSPDYEKYILPLVSIAVSGICLLISGIYWI